MEDAKQDPLDDPHMDGETWIAIENVTQNMLDAWPVWQWQRWPDSRPGRVGYISAWVAGRTAKGMGGMVLREGCYGVGYLRPLRLPGMNSRGEIAAKDMTQAHFDRVPEWQWRAQCTDADNGSHVWRSWAGGFGGYGMVHVGDYVGEVWRPAIFSQLDEETV